MTNGGEGGDLHLIGRARELRMLADVAAGARNGSGRLVVVAGETGSGKTLLCEQAAASARAAGLAVAWGSCWPDGGAPALWPWHTLLRELCGDEATSLLDGDSGVEGVGPERFSRFAAVAERLAEAAARRPTLIVIDDLHAADAGSVLLTRFVSRTLRQRSLAIVVTRRTQGGSDPSSSSGSPTPDPGVTLIDSLEDEDGATVITVGGFGYDDTSAFLRAAGERAADAELVRAAHQVTGGNPLFLRRLLALGQRRSPVEALPAGIRTAIVGAIDRLTPAAGATLRTAAVLGLTPSVADVAALAGSSTTVVLGAVDEAVGVGLIARRDLAGFSFGHELVRETLESLLPPTDRLDAHARAAQLLARPGGPDGEVGQPGRLARRAHHALCAAGRSADDADRAVDLCRAAARDMVRRFSYERAEELLRRAAALGGSGEHGGVRAGLLVEWAEAVLACGRLSEARGLFDRAVVAADEEGDPVLVARAAIGLGGLWVGQHRSRLERERVLGWQRRALDGLPEAEAGLRARLSVRLAAEEAYPGGQVEHVFAALADARATGEPAVLAEALSLTHHTLLTPVHTRSRLRLADELVRVAADGATTAAVGPLALLGLCWRAVDLFHLGDPRAEQVLVDARARADAVGCQGLLFVAEVMTVMLLLRDGRLDEAEKRAHACYELGCEVGDADALACFGAHLVAIAWFRGRDAEVLHAVTEIAESPSLLSGDFTYDVTVAALAARSGDLPRARAALDKVTAGGLAALPQSSTWLAAMLSIVEAAAALGDADIATEAYQLLVPFADQPIMPSLAVACFGSTERPLGLAALTFGEPGLAVDHLQRAVAANQRLGNRPLVAISTADLATALEARGLSGDRERAAEHLDSAVQMADTLSLDARAAAWAGERDRLRQGAGAAVAVFRREGTHWIVALDERQVLVPDRVGMRYLARLLAEPGVDVPATVLAYGNGGVADGSAQPVLDQRARDELERRAREVAAEIADAEERSDLGWADKLRDEFDAIVTELERATGLGGRARSFAGPGERARTAVHKAIGRALSAIEARDAELGARLRSGVTTGTTCCYRPPVGDAIRWSVRMG